ncbi:MAG: hypothetical protein JNM80_01530 [Phycisphaerae bacterium]|nr:hypothetical protein [Phycisphaerae bacterium]
MLHTATAVLVLASTALAQPTTLPIATAGTTTAPSIMFDLVPDSPTAALSLTSICATLNVPAGTPVILTLYGRTDSYVGYEASPIGWSLLHSRQVISAGPSQPTGMGVQSFPVAFLQVGSSRRGFALLADVPKGTTMSVAESPPAATTYADGTLRLHIGPATGSPPWSAIVVPAAAMVGRITYEPYTPCMVYANCDGSTTPPALNVNDFVCFNEYFAAGFTLANCDQSTTPPVLNVLDFICFLNAYARGCTAP